MVFNYIRADVFWKQLQLIIESFYNYGLSICAEVDDLEWPWSGQNAYGVTDNQNVICYKCNIRPMLVLLTTCWSKANVISHNLFDLSEKQNLRNELQNHILFSFVNWYKWRKIEWLQYKDQVDAYKKRSIKRAMVGAYFTIHYRLSDKT